MAKKASGGTETQAKQTRRRKKTARQPKGGNGQSQGYLSDDLAPPTDGELERLARELLKASKRRDKADADIAEAKATMRARMLELGLATYPLHDELDGKEIAAETREIAVKIRKKKDAAEE